MQHEYPTAEYIISLYGKHKVKWGKYRYVGVDLDGNKVCCSAGVLYLDESDIPYNSFMGGLIDGNDDRERREYGFTASSEYVRGYETGTKVREHFMSQQEAA